MRLPRPLLLLAIAVLLTCFSASNAHAQTLAGLQLELRGDIPDTIEEDLHQTTAELLGETFQITWIPFDEARPQLGAVIRDCFTDECLQRAGETLDAQLGLAIDFVEDKSIYQWSIDLFDLQQGSLIRSEQGGCELCGRSEVIDQFRNSLATLRHAGSAGPIDTGLHSPGADTVEIRVTVVPDDARIFIDEEPAGIGYAEVHLPAGTYEIRLSHETYHGVRETLIVDESSPPLVIIRAHLSGATSQQRMVLSRGDGLIDHIEANRKLMGWSALGVGAVLTIAGYIVTNLHGQPNCPGSTDFTRCPDLYRTAGLGTTVAILGGISMISGAVLLTWPWLAGKQNEEPHQGSSLQLNAGPSGLSISGRF